MDQPSVPDIRGAVPRAGFGQRFAAFFIDSVLVNVASFVVTNLVGDGRGAGANFISILIFFAYFVFFEGGRGGQTLGKRALGIRVVDFESGTTIDYGRAFARTFGRLISGFVLLLGYLWMLWDRDRQTWHDKIASTTVVPVSDFPLVPPPEAA